MKPTPTFNGRTWAVILGNDIIAPLPGPDEAERIAALIATAIRDAYERAAQVCDELAAERTQRLEEHPNYTLAQKHYFVDMRAAYQSAAARIRALKGIG